MKTKRQRQAFTLIEIITVMGVFSILMSIAVAWIVQTMRLDSTLRLRHSAHNTMMLLDRQLRNDIRRGQTMLLTDNNELIIEFADSQTASYRLDKLQIHYKQSTGRQETFALLDSASARWEKSLMPDSIGLIILRSADNADTSPVDLYVRGQINSGQTLVAVDNVPEAVPAQ